MSLTDAFNSMNARRDSATSLQVTSPYGNTMYMVYDFAQRVLVTYGQRLDGGIAVTPFSQLDREVLVAAREKLVSLGGTPPDLPPEDPQLPPKRKALNL